jgi:hypothetical protein
MDNILWSDHPGLVDNSDGRHAFIAVNHGVMTDRTDA